jgi:menaquinol-cytochrome c reductase cytochrome b/c subunit
MPSRAAREREEQHRRYKEDVQRRGKAFYPWAMFHDTVMSVVVVSVIIGLAVVWYFTSGPEPTDTGLLGPRYTEEADPGTIDFIPRPDWFFFFLFYLLRIFEWPDSVILGTVGIPTILLILLVLLPFVDRRRERRPTRRPVAIVALGLTIVSMGVLTYEGATAEETLGSVAVLRVPEWVEQNNLPAEAEPGAELFAETGCLNCHIYLGAGSQNLGAPDLSAIGLTERGPDGFAQLLRQPPPPMPSFAELGDENLQEIGIFLHHSRGGETVDAGGEATGGG